MDGYIQAEERVTVQWCIALDAEEINARESGLISSRHTKSPVYGQQCSVSILSLGKWGLWQERHSCEKWILQKILLYEYNI